MSVEQRQQLAEQQAALVRALAGEANPPDGFDAGNVGTAAAALLVKRRRGVEKTWPGVAESLGDRFPKLFADYARSRSIPPGGHGADGRHFAQYLRRLGLLSDAGRIQLLLAQMGGGPIGVAYLPEARRIVIAYKCFDGVRRFTLPWIFRSRFARRQRRIAGAEEAIDGA
jgi:hypothetical protein